MDDTLDQELVPFDKSKFILYRSFINLQEAQALEQLLMDHDIPYDLNVPQTPLDASIIGQGIVTKATIKVFPNDVQRIDALLEKELEQNIEATLASTPLQSYTNEELYDMLQKPDEWTVENTTLAKRILADRGMPVDEAELKRLRETRIQEMRKGKKGSLSMMIFAFVAIFYGLFTQLSLSPLIGIFAGLYYNYAKRHDLNGTTYLEYESQTRLIGKIMIACFLAVAAFKLYNYYLA